MSGAATAATARDVATVRLNPFDAGSRTDPYPHYRALREQNPVHRTLGMWVLTRHADVTALLRDRTTSVALLPELGERQAQRLVKADPTLATPPTLARIARLARTSLVFTDDPAHARLRALAGPVFGPRTLAALRPTVRAEADRLVDDLVRAGGGDAVPSLAAPLPLAVLTAALGLPAELRPQIADWTHRLRFLLEPGMLGAESFAQVAAAVEEFTGVLRDIVAQRRRTPGDDLVSVLTTARSSGEGLDEEELVFVAMMTFIAGLETTTALIGNGLYALLTRPDQAAVLRAEPARIPAAVTELLRYDSPLQLTKRLTTRDTEVGGHTIPQGAQVLLCLGAANRDPAVFADPDTLDVTRTATSHLAYGRGMHGCVGAALASLVAEDALAALFRGTAELELDGPVAWQEHSQIVRGVARLPVVLR